MIKISIVLPINRFWVQGNIGSKLQGSTFWVQRFRVSNYVAVFKDP